VSPLEKALGLGLALLLAYFAFSAAGDDFPLNLAIGVLAFVASAGLLFSVGGRDRL